MTVQKTRVLLADDHTIFRKSLREVIDKQSDMAVVGEARDGIEAVQQAEELAPDVILMDINMPNMDGVKATRLIVEQADKVGIVVLTMYKEEAHVFQAIKAGAQGYILKGADMEELLKAIRSVRRGEPMIDASIAGRVLVEFAALVREQERQDYLALSKRQTEILQLLARGGTNKDIAETLLISEFTVRNALSAIFEKLHVNNRTEAAVCAVEKGLLDLN